MAATCLGITMYDIRTTWKGVAQETIAMGMSVYLSSADNDIRRLDAVNGQCHGWALESVVAGETLTIVTACRMTVDLVQVPGRRACVGNVAGCPSTTWAGTLAVGFGLSTTTIWLHVPMQVAEV